MRSFLFISFLVAACGSSPKPAPSEPAPAVGGNDALIAKGGQLYGEKCARCHGDAGQGTDKAPAVVGVDKGALPLDPREGSKRDVQFHTAADIGGWAAKHMPADAPGSLSLDDYVAILAFDLHANGVDLGSEPFTLDRAAQITIHP
ncbi:MAG TPA: c-type cytochrome [Kofleriaceae bacterium]|jgi:cytochrome c|nr:c-type cytochrome [Kofleriaceae bacterium]